MTTMTRDIHTDTTDAAARDKTATIASISDQDWHITRTHGVFHIPACPKGEACALLLVTPRGDAIDLGDNHRFPFTISARDIADDLIQDLGNHGVFVCAEAQPSDDELARARARRDSWYKQLVADADEMWARGHSYREISDMHRRAAMAMGLEREWAYVPQRQMDCPACGEKVKPGVALCKHCGAILDNERATRYGLGKPRDVAAPRVHQPAAQTK
ncbi:MAG TPA: zinc ribbon domain-containing protein [Candidatus Acidoferrales bacterium]|nr:zinc ribbon domain-containing protein [Candidatus Acidoferrales bacterium]